MENIQFILNEAAIQFDSIQFRWQLFQINWNAVARSIRTYLTNHIITVHTVCGMLHNAIQSNPHDELLFYTDEDQFHISTKIDEEKWMK